MVMMIHDNITNQDVPLPAATGCYLSWELNVQCSLFLVGVSGVTGVTAVFDSFFDSYTAHTPTPFTSARLVGVRAVIGELLSTDRGAGVSTLHSPLAACRRSTPAY